VLKKSRTDPGSARLCFFPKRDGRILFLVFVLAVFLLVLLAGRLLQRGTVAERSALSDEPYCAKASFTCEISRASIDPGG